MLAGSGNFAAIAGLYDATEEDDLLGTDIFYVEITQAGSIIGYDYQQDEFDDGDNCYIIDSGTSVLRQTATSTYTNVYYEDTEFNCDTLTEEGIIITRSGSTLTSESADRGDLDNDGDTTERVVETLQVLTGLSSTDFNACE